MSGLPLCRAVPLAHPQPAQGAQEGANIPPTLHGPCDLAGDPRDPRNPQECRRHPGCRLLPVPAPSTASNRQISAENGSCCPFRGRGGGACWGEERRGCPGVSGLGYPRKAPNLHPVGNGISARENVGGREAGGLKGDWRNTRIWDHNGLAPSIQQGFPVPCSKQDLRHLLVGCVAGLTSRVSRAVSRVL